MTEAITDDWIEITRVKKMVNNVEDDVKELAVLLARINHPSRVDTGNGKDAAWRQWVCYSRVILAAGYHK